MELPAELHRDLIDYGRLLGECGMAIEVAKLVVPMLERFIATDRGLAEAGRQQRAGVTS